MYSFTQSTSHHHVTQKPVPPFYLIFCFQICHHCPLRQLFLFLIHEHMSNLCIGLNISLNKFNTKLKRINTHKTKTSESKWRAFERCRHLYISGQHYTDMSRYWREHEIKSPSCEFAILKPVWTSSIRTKHGIIKSNVKSVRLYEVP